MEVKRKRCHNFSAVEEEFLVQLVTSKYRNVIECKKTDAVFNKKKWEAWENICNEFNANNSVFRDAKTLKSKYENIKKKKQRESMQMKKNMQVGLVEVHQNKFRSYQVQN